MRDKGFMRARGDAGQGALRLVLSLILAFSVAFSASFATPFAAPHQAWADVRDDDRVAGQLLTDPNSPVVDAPDIDADYAALCTEDGAILWERDAGLAVPDENGDAKRMFLASTTKVMTAVVALERCEPDTPMLVTYGAANTDGSSASLREGDTTTFRDLLVGMMVPSGNDAAVAISENIAGTEFAFVDLMNAKAAELGMTQTHFSNASGIVDESNYSTPKDYLLLVRYAMQKPLFREVVGQSEATAYFGGREEYFTSTNHLFELMDGVIGIKTGFTDEAGYCFVGAAQRNGIELYVVVFHASNEMQRFYDAKALLEWGFAHYRSFELIKADAPVANLALTSWIDKSIEVNAAAPVVVTLFDYTGAISVEIRLSDWEGGITRGEKVGTVVFSQGGEVLATCDVLASETVPAPGFWEWISIGWCRFWGGIIGDAPHEETKLLLPDTISPLS